MSNATVILRDTISGRTVELTPERAQSILDHPTFGKRNEIVERDEVGDGCLDCKVDEPVTQDNEVVSDSDVSTEPTDEIEGGN